MAKITGAVPLGGMLSPFDTNDTYAISWQNYVKGGHHSVLYYEDMLEISKERRIVGMTCYVDEDKKTYQLVGGVDNKNWESLKTSQNITPTFIINSVITEGVQPLIIKIPEKGVITGIEAICGQVGLSDCEIDIEKISELGFETNTGWTSIFNNNENLKILARRTSNKTAPNYILNDGIVKKGDVLRLNIKKVGIGMRGLTVHLSVQC